MKVPPKFLLDENISPKVATLLTKRGINAQAVAGSTFAGLSDEEILALSLKEGRVLVTYNSRHFKPLLAALIAKGVEGPGLVFVSPSSIPSSNPSAVASALLRLAHEIVKGNVNVSWGIYLERAER